MSQPRRCDTECRMLRRPTGARAAKQAWHHPACLDDLVGVVRTKCRCVGPESTSIWNSQSFITSVVHAAVPPWNFHFPWCSVEPHKVPWSRPEQFRGIHIIPTCQTIRNSKNILWNFVERSIWRMACMSCQRSKWNVFRWTSVRTTVVLDYGSTKSGQAHSSHACRQN